MQTEQKLTYIRAIGTYLDMITLIHTNLLCDSKIHVHCLFSIENNNLLQIRTTYVVRLDPYSLTIIYGLTLKIDINIYRQSLIFYTY